MKINGNVTADVANELLNESVGIRKIGYSNIGTFFVLVAALIYWRDPKKSGPVFGCILGVLLSLAYFSLISVLAYLSLLVLTGTIAIRIHNTVLQAIQKTSDGHPFKSVLQLLRLKLWE